jgi:hypothetical protein
MEHNPWDPAGLSAQVRTYAAIEKARALSGLATTAAPTALADY